MDFSSQIIPAVIVLFANLLSGKHGTSRWETVTAIFGWIAFVSLIAYLIVVIVLPENSVSDYVLQVLAFSLLTALSRDYEKILYPLFNRKN